jgi:acyl-CoA reductase-like NAD-dependent aldehyde dehydrogenase
MLVDGKLIDADSGETFDNINPATEEVLGQVADGSTSEMLRAIDAARRAFDETDWATNRSFRKSVYGLAGGVYSGSLEHSQAVASRIRAGTMSINGGAPYGADVPFGGYKHSGIGRQNGTAGFEQYVEIKSVAWPKA